MDKVKVKKRGFAALYRLCPARHILALASAGIIILHLLTRHDHSLMAAMSEKVIRPLHRGLARFTALFGFSAAELLIGAAAAAVIVYIIVSAARIICGKHKWRQVYITAITLASAGLAVYAGFCVLWGVFYYGDDFTARSGLETRKISTRELTVVTEYFADLANEYAPLVDRDENGVCRTDRAEVLERSPEVYRAAEQLFRSLEGPEIPAKGIKFSRLMSYTDFTGFFFPFTAEATVNMDFPPSLFASTVAHELAHQRGVAKEQEANFVAVMASLTYGDADYCYSASLLAYTHLGNALYKADVKEWERIYGSLSEPVLRDFAANREYWKQFETPVQTVSNSVYEGFLQSYDQEMGLKSYGACVDLLVNYYYGDALRHLAGKLTAN